MREKLFSCLKKAGADVGRKEKPTKEWNRLASINIPISDLDDDPDINAISNRIFNRVHDFVSKHVPVYNEALKSLEAK